MTHNPTANRFFRFGFTFMGKASFRLSGRVVHLVCHA